MRISDWSSDVCSSDLIQHIAPEQADGAEARADAVHQRRVELRHRRLAPHDHLQRLARDRHLQPVGDEAGHFPIESQRMLRSEEHTSELQSLMRISYAVFCLKKKKSTKDKSN